MLAVCVGSAGGAMLAGCAAQALIDDASPRLVEGGITAGSKLTETSQYVEVRLTFDHELEATGNVSDDVDVQVNGQAPDTRSMKVDVYVEGSSVVVRLVPSSAADGSQTSLYYALYDGLVSVAARDARGGLPHVRLAQGQSNAVLDGVQSFTVPSGVQVVAVSTETGDAAAGVPASVTFDVERFAQLRSVTWFSFFDGAPLVRMHNHEFLRDTNQTCAARLADTINATYADSFEAEAQGARVTVRAKDVAGGQEPRLLIVEGAGVDPQAAGALS